MNFVEPNKVKRDGDIAFNTICAAGGGPSRLLDTAKDVIRMRHTGNASALAQHESALRALLESYLDKGCLEDIREALRQSEASMEDVSAGEEIRRYVNA